MILFFQIIFVLSLLGILYFIIRRIPDILKLPRKEEFETEVGVIQKNIQEQWDKVKEKADKSEFLHDTIIPKTEKVLRKTKIILLKLDNFLAKRVNKLRRKIRKRKEENGE